MMYAYVHAWKRSRTGCGLQKAACLPAFVLARRLAARCLKVSYGKVQTFAVGVRSAPSIPETLAPIRLQKCNSVRVGVHDSGCCPVLWLLVYLFAPPPLACVFAIFVLGKLVHAAFRIFCGASARRWKRTTLHKVVVKVDSRCFFLLWLVYPLLPTPFLVPVMTSFVPGGVPSGMISPDIFFSYR